jgi:gamma-glutamyltranspeptidase/glutathione hydrolase
MQTEAPALTAQHGHAFGTPATEIGATTGIEFFDRGRLLAAAEPVRRGGGSAMVVKKDR